MTTRIEHDSMGPVEVPADSYYGAQTERSRRNFRIGSDPMPMAVVHALALVKKAAALANGELGLIDATTRDLIVQASDEVLAGKFDAHFPLVVWQTGSGTQTNMNVNEVIANRAIELAGGEIGSKKPVHPNDHVNLSQSSNDAFPTAIHLAAVAGIEDRLLPALGKLRATLEQKAADFMDVVKTGRTHLQDATPLTLGQEISGWAQQLQDAQDAVAATLPQLRRLALGGTAVGTGLGAPAGYAAEVTAQLRQLTGRDFVSAPNKFAALAGNDALVGTSGALQQVAVACMKIANDVRWLASGPRCGIGEISIPENEPGSSIMPGKVNPTQCEAMTMICAQVFGNSATIAFAGSQGNFELGVFKPVMALNLLQSITLLADGCDSFREHCAAGIQPRLDEIARSVGRSLMLVTALRDRLGYDAAAKIAAHAHAGGGSLRDAAIELEAMTGEEFDAAVRPENMVGRPPI